MGEVKESLMRIINKVGLTPILCADGFKEGAARKSAESEPLRLHQE